MYIAVGRDLRLGTSESRIWIYLIPASLPSPAPSIHLTPTPAASLATTVSWIKPRLSCRTLRCTSSSGWSAAHSCADLHIVIHREGHGEDYRLYADHPVRRENCESSFRIFHDGRYRDIRSSQGENESQKGDRIRRGSRIVWGRVAMIRSFAILNVVRLDAILFVIC